MGAHRGPPSRDEMGTSTHHMVRLVVSSLTSISEKELSVLSSERHEGVYEAEVYKFRSTSQSLAW